MLQCSSKSHSLTPRKTIMVIICTNAPWKPVWTHAFNEFVLDNIHFCPAFQRQITQFTMCLPVKHLQRRTESEPPLNALSLRLKLSVQSLFARAVGVEEGTPSLPRTGRAQRTRNLLIHSSNNTSTRCFRAVNNSVQKKKKKMVSHRAWFARMVDYSRGTRFIPSPRGLLRTKHLCFY